MNHNQTIANICKQVREKWELTGHLPEQHNCKEISIAICILAAENNIDTILCFGEFIESTDAPRDHFWVRKDGIIYDATADQFFACEKIYISKEGQDNRYKEKDFVTFNSLISKLTK
ncbi:TPA: hypothetical protein ACPZNJ_000339 [Yersinia enterocolitica]